MANNLKAGHLKSSKQFAHIKTNGKTLNGAHWLLCNYCENEGLGLRVGWTLPTYVGTAVVRNRLKRWLREYLKKLNSDFLKTPVDVNLVMRKKDNKFYSRLEHGALDEALAETFRKISRSVESKRQSDSKAHH